LEALGPEHGGPYRGEVTRLLLPSAAVLLVLGLVTPVLMPMVGRVDLVLVDQSVRPGLHRGDVLLTRPAAERDLRPGRVVIVDSDEGRVVHRIRAVGDGPRLRGGGMSAATRIAVDGSGGASPGCRSRTSSPPGSPPSPDPTPR